MRITSHGNDLLVTDQSLGLGAFLVAFGVLGLVAALSGMAEGNWFAAPTLAYGVGGGLAVWLGLERLVATQLIVDPDERTITVKRWTIGRATSQRVRLADLDRLAIEPEGQAAKTRLVIHARDGAPSIAVGLTAHRAAWEEIVDAIARHLDGSRDHVSPDSASS